MKTILNLVVLQSLVLTASFATTLSGNALPACATGVALTVYQGYGDDGCSFAKVTFGGDQYDVTIQYSKFQVLSSADAGASLPTKPKASDITVTAPTKIGDALGFFSNKFEVGAGQKLIFIFEYTIDPPPSVIPGYETEMFAETPVFPGYANYKTQLCVGGYFGGSKGCVDVLSGEEKEVLALETYIYTKSTKEVKTKAAITFDQPTFRVDVRNTLELYGGPLGGAIDPDTGKKVIGSSQISGVRNTVPAAVPEPMGLMLAGSGLAVLALIRRRMAS
ncbi:MAG: hypothetical protein NTV70_03520 [Acidobacteria bacterium]|nr:hypothetical protein [Acidobacteriota bacterium]